MFWLLSVALLVISFLVFVFTLAKHQIRIAKSPLRKLPGPPSQSWLYGNIKQIFERGQSVAWDEWVSTYGRTFLYRDMFNVRFLFHSTVSPLASTSCFPDSLTLYHGPPSDKPRPHTLGRVSEAWRCKSYSRTLGRRYTFRYGPASRSIIYSPSKVSSLPKVKSTANRWV